MFGLIIPFSSDANIIIIILKLHKSFHMDI